MNIPATVDLTQKVKLEIPEIRVWIHNSKGGDDTYKVFNSFKEAVEFTKTQEGAEQYPLIAFKGYELGLWLIKKEVLCQSN